MQSNAGLRFDQRGCRILLSLDGRDPGDFAELLRLGDNRLDGAGAYYLMTWSFGLPPLGEAEGGVGSDEATEASAAASRGKNRPWLFSLAKMPVTASIGIEHSRDTPLKRA